MAGKSKRPPLLLTPEEVQHLKRLRRSRKAPAREVQRAEILWRYHRGETIAEIMRAVKMTRKKRCQMDRARPRHGGGSGAQGRLSSSPTSPASPKRPRPGWCTWPAASPSNWDTPPSCGPAARSLGTCASMPWKRAIRPWPKRPRRRSTGFWPPNRCIRRR